MDYTTLVQCILNNDILSKAVKDLANRTKVLNLITPEWKSVLENNEIYQLHLSGKAQYSTGHSVAKEKAYCKRLKYKNEMFTFIIAGEWSLSKSKDKEDEYSIVSRGSEPLQLIAYSMRENPGTSLHDGGRFFIRHCNPDLCSDCRLVHQKYKVPFALHNWCVKSLQTFDGTQLSITFASKLQECLPKLGSFMGIFRMEIQSRLTFGSNCYKISGMVDEMIIFQHSILLPLERMCVESAENVPSIEFPDEDSIEDKNNR